jgi:hypothetical protein
MLPLVARKGQYGHSWMRAAVAARVAADRASASPHEELCKYLDSPLECVDNIVAWWGVCHYLNSLTIYY